MGDAVDEPGQTARALEQRLDGGAFEQGEFAAAKTQAVGEVVVELVAVDAPKVLNAIDGGRSYRWIARDLGISKRCPGAKW